MRFSQIEKRHLIRSWLVVSIVYTIASMGEYSLAGLFFMFTLSAATVGVGFMLHEISHKLVAQRYGYFAEYRANDQMLLLSIVFALFGFIFIAPGAVLISAWGIPRDKNGKISLAGPLANLVLALVSIPVLFFSPLSLVSLVAYFNFQVNTWLALFNLLPFGNFDGVKVLAWNRVVYFITISAAGALMLLSYYL